MSVHVTQRAAEVIRRGFTAARLDPADYAVRVRALPSGVHIAFAEEPAEGDEVLELDEIRVFVARSIAERDSTIDVSSEHDQLIVR